MSILPPTARSAGELGFVASLTLRGTPPFKLSYQVQRQGVQSAKPQYRTKTINGLQEELTLQEEIEGTYLYEWKSLSDANYPLGIDLDEERKMEDVTQVVHPLARAELVLGRGTGKKVIWACKGSEVPVEVDLKVCLSLSLDAEPLEDVADSPPFRRVLFSLSGQGSVLPHRRHHLPQVSRCYHSHRPPSSSSEDPSPSP